MLHVLLGLVHAAVSVAVLVSSRRVWMRVVVVRRLLGRRGLQASRVLAGVDGRRVGGVGVVRMIGDRGGAE